jgi:hypothetical protein
MHIEADDSERCVVAGNDSLGQSPEPLLRIGVFQIIDVDGVFRNPSIVSSGVSIQGRAAPVPSRNLPLK